MSNLMVNETYLNATKGCRFRDSDYYESRYDETELGELYRSCVREYGRCTGKVYVDRENGTPLPVGWVFISRQRYDDCCDQTYLREVRVTYARKVTIIPPKRIIEYVQ